MTSALLVNNEYGENYIKDINWGGYIEYFNIDDLINDNPSLTHCTSKKDEKRQQLEFDYNTKGLEYCVDKYYSVSKLQVLIDKIPFANKVYKKYISWKKR